MQSSACLGADLARVSASGVSARSSEQIVRTVLRADGPHALTTGLPARIMQAVPPCKRIAPASRSGGAHLPLPQRQPLGLCRAAAAVVLVACSGTSSLCCPTQSHSDRH